MAESSRQLKDVDSQIISRVKNRFLFESTQTLWISVNHLPPQCHDVSHPESVAVHVFSHFPGDITSLYLQVSCIPWSFPISSEIPPVFENFLAMSSVLLCFSAVS